RLFRFRRRGCQDGVYTHEGRECCLCAAGQRLKKPCSTGPEDGECELCETGTYNPVANSQPNCEPCTSCSQHNANLEQEEACTPYRNRVCRCKQNHYCVSGTEPCTACKPCTECGGEGNKVACTATNNAVCNDKNEGGINLAAVLIPIFIGITLIVLVLVYCWKKKGFVKIAQLLNCATPEVTPTEAEEMEQLKGKQTTKTCFVCCDIRTFIADSSVFHLCISCGSLASPL
uniref:tumor necrosis factor receptor superfamily member 6 n=1 Tax=Centroberyx gerrardi TaxID=166262 RepID=UPI003AAE3C1F